MAVRPRVTRYRSDDEELEHYGSRKQVETDMKDEIARLRAHHIEDLRPIAKTLEALAKDVNGLLRRWEAELNPEEEEPAERFEPPITPKRVE
jgi:phage host-nuclease inhibitor protein Gam